jgi:drug/metabolite transporter (DMT)-like permease
VYRGAAVSKQWECRAIDEKQVPCPHLLSSYPLTLIPIILLPITTTIRATIESNDEITEQQPPATTPSKVKSEDPIMKPLSVVVRKFFSIGSREIVVDDDKLKRHVTFRVLGMEIGSWSRTSQFLFCSLMGIGFLLMYGLLQEFVVMNKFHRSLGWFITFLQLSGYAICGSFEQHLFANKLHERKIPLRYYCLFAILHVTMQGCTNLAMQYLNYPAKTLFKSSRVIVTMLFGGCFMGKTYHSRDYLVAAMIITGLSLFVVCDAQTSPVFDPLGIFYIALALCADSAILNVQEFCLNAYNAGHDELVYYTYMGSAFVAFLMSMIKGLRFISYPHSLPSPLLELNVLCRRDVARDCLSSRDGLLLHALHVYCFLQHGLPGDVLLRCAH